MSIRLLDLEPGDRVAALQPALDHRSAIDEVQLRPFTDDDVTLHPEWLSLKKTFDETDCAGVAGRIIPVWQNAKPDWLEMEQQQAVVNCELGDELKRLEDDPPLGANSAFRRKKFEKYGLFQLDLGVSGDNRNT